MTKTERELTELTRPITARIALRTMRNWSYCTSCGDKIFSGEYFMRWASRAPPTGTTLVSRMHQECWDWHEAKALQNPSGEYSWTYRRYGTPRPEVL